MVIAAPTCGVVVESAGAALFAGAPDATAPEVFELAPVDPVPFVAVTTQLSVCPTSPATGV